MKQMRLLNPLSLIVLFALSLTACSSGGGGGDGGGGGISYSGTTSQAVSTSDNATNLAVSAYRGGDMGSDFGGATGVVVVKSGEGVSTVTPEIGRLTDILTHIASRIGKDDIASNLAVGATQLPTPNYNGDRVRKLRWRIHDDFKRYIVR